jgi:polyhydroxyalkanoate synthesis regulator protein
MENMYLMLTSLFVMVVCAFAFNILSHRKLTKAMRNLEQDMRENNNLGADNNYYIKTWEEQIHRDMRWIQESLDTLVDMSMKKKVSKK